jgi:glutamyl-Q tRNA(Asp) synthetase
MQMALRRIGEQAFDETGPSAPGWHTIDPQALIEGTGDVVLARRDFGTSYHLSVVLDDAHQGVTHVVRGQDLFEATAIHVVLQALLDLRVPRYHHHRLIRDETGRRLAKRDDARAIRLYREDGKTPAELREMLGLGPQPSG